MIWIAPTQIIPISQISAFCVDLWLYVFFFGEDEDGGTEGNDQSDTTGDKGKDKGGKSNGGKNNGGKNNGGKNSGGKKAKDEQPDMMKLEGWLFGGQGQPVKSSRVLQSVQQRKAATRTDHLKSLHNVARKHDVALRASRI